MHRQNPVELTLPRRLFHQSLAIDIGNRDVAAYHRRPSHEDVNLDSVCGQEA